MTKFSLRMNKDWDEEFYKGQEMRDEIEFQTADVAAAAIKEAPLRPSGKQPWNAIKKNISAYIDEDAQGWYGNVVVEADARVRHAMLQDQGFRTPAGRRVPGRQYLKKALEKSRLE